MTATAIEHDQSRLRHHFTIFLSVCMKNKNCLTLFSFSFSTSFCYPQFIPLHNYSSRCSSLSSPSSSSHFIIIINNCRSSSTIVCHTPVQLILSISSPLSPTEIPLFHAETKQTKHKIQPLVTSADHRATPCVLPLALRLQRFSSYKKSY